MLADQRFLLLDALMALGRGRLLHRGGESSFATVLYGVPDAVLVFEDLLTRGWIADVDGKGRRYAMTPAGRQALREGAAWYLTLPTWRRAIRPRFGLATAVRTADLTVQRWGQSDGPALH